MPFIFRVARELGTLYLRDPELTLTPRPGFTLTPEVEANIAAVMLGAQATRRKRAAHEQLVATNNATIWVAPLNVDGVTGVTYTTPPIHNQYVQHKMAQAHRLHERAVETWWVKQPVTTDAMTGLVSWAVAEITATTAVWVEGPSDLKGKGVWTDSGENPIGEIPVVMLRGSDPEPGEWMAPLPSDLLSAQRAIDADLTEVGFVATLQSNGQPVIRSSQAIEALEMGADSAIHIRDPEGGFTYESPGADLSGCIEQIEQYIRTVIAHNGLNPATFLKSSGITALAKQIELVDRAMERERHEIEFRRAEARLYSLTRKWVNWLRAGDVNATVWPECDVSVEYRIPQPPADPLIAANATATNISTGITSAARDRSLALGISIEEAQALVLEDRNLTAAAQGITAETDEPAEVIEVEESE